MISSLRHLSRSLLACTAASLAITGSALAGNETGTVTNIFVRNDGLHWVQLSGTHQARPACAATQEYWILRDENSNTGKDQFAMLLSAYMSGKLVIMDGSNACARWFDGEDIGTVSLQ